MADATRPPNDATIPLGDFSSVLLDSLVEQVAVIDPGGTILYVNDAWRRSAEHGGAALAAVAPGSNYVAALRRAAQREPPVAVVLNGIECVLGGFLDRFEHDYECETNTGPRWFNQRVVALRGSSGGAVIAHLDITERKSTERDRDAHRFELGRAVRAATLGQLSGALAHELNQPLTAILANAQVGGAALRSATGQQPLLGELFADVEADARRAGKIIHRVRALLAKQAPRLEAVDLNQLVDDTLALCRSELLVHRVEVECRLDADLPVVTGDPIELQHVLLNLVVNASEALQGSDRQPRRLRISTAARRGGAVHVEVADNGPGIDPAQGERLFDAFHTSKVGGLGLGLSICRSVVEAHGGTIRIANDDSAGGAVVAFEIPAAPADAIRSHSAGSG